jgi:Tol biopolymer transport system component
MVSEFAQELRVVDSRGRLFYVLPHYVGQYEILQSEPSWSPDSTRIAYRAEFRTFSSIYVVTRTGGLVHTLETEHGDYAGSPTWSPDSKRLAYEKTVHGEPTSIYTARSDGSDRRLVLNSASDPDWSPDGSRLAYVTPSAQGSEIAIANVDGSSVRLLTSSPERESNPAWSPDGKLIAFERTDDESGRNWIVVVRSDTGAEVGVVRGAFDAHNPAWRPPVVLPRAKRRPCR